MSDTNNIDTHSPPQAQVLSFQAAAERKKKEARKSDYELALTHAQEQLKLIAEQKKHEQDKFAKYVLETWFTPENMAHAVATATQNGVDADYVDIYLPSSGFAKNENTPKAGWGDITHETESMTKFRSDFLKASKLRDLVFLRGERPPPFGFVTRDGIRILLKEPETRHLFGLIPAGKKPGIGCEMKFEK